MTNNKEKMTTKTTKPVIIAGLVLSLTMSIGGAVPVFAASAGYLGVDMGDNITELTGNVFVYDDLMSSSNEQILSIIYASNGQSSASAAFTVGVGYFGQGASGSDSLWWASYYDEGSTNDNIVKLGGTVTSGSHSVKVTKSGSNWFTSGDGNSLETLACPSGGCPSSFRFAGAAPNSNTDITSMTFKGSFSNLQVKTGGSSIGWDSQAIDQKCNGSSGVGVIYSNLNSVSMDESGNVSCNNPNWGWMYNEQTGFFGVS